MASRKTIRSTIKTALDAVSLFATGGVVAVIDNGDRTSTATMEEELRSAGMVLAIEPAQSSAVTDQGTRLALERLLLAVHVRCNATVAASSTGCQVDPDDAVDAVIATLLELGAPGNALQGLRMGSGETMTTLVEDDDGLLTTAILCTIPRS